MAFKGSPLRRKAMQNTNSSEDRNKQCKLMRLILNSRPTNERLGVQSLTGPDFFTLSKYCFDQKPENRLAY